MVLNKINKILIGSLSFFGVSTILFSSSLVTQKVKYDNLPFRVNFSFKCNDGITNPKIWKKTPTKVASNTSFKVSIGRDEDIVYGYNINSFVVVSKSGSYQFSCDAMSMLYSKYVKEEYPTFGPWCVVSLYVPKEIVTSDINVTVNISNYHK